MKRSILALLLVALTSLSSVARAEGRTDGKAAAAGTKDDSKDKDAKARPHRKFPMPAAEFKQRSDARLAKAKAKLEDRIKAKKLSDERAKVLRARFDSVSAVVNRAVARAGADGTVTKDEAQDVHDAAKEARREARKLGRKAQKPAPKEKK